MNVQYVHICLTIRVKQERCAPTSPTLIFGREPKSLNVNYTEINNADLHFIVLYCMSAHILESHAAHNSVCAQAYFIFMPL